MRTRLPISGLLLLAAITIAVVVPACQDPVHDAEVAALGPENPQVPRGQYHRAGQPCTVCHGPEGPASTQFSVAGTIFWQPYVQPSGQNQGELGVNNATVSIIDDLGSTIQVNTNCVGNFWVTPGAYNPAFPILVNVFAEGQKFTQPMFTQISRWGSCGECHIDPPNYNTVGHVYMTTGGVPAAEQNVSCPVDPNLAHLSGPPQ
jgi:hypothetical protein